MSIEEKIALVENIVSILEDAIEEMYKRMELITDASWATESKPDTEVE